MFRTVILFSILAVAFSQYSRQRAPPRQPPPEYEDYEDYQPRSQPAPQPRPQAPPPPPRPNPNSMRLKPASVHYVNIGTELAGDYKFGYDTGKADDGQSFREETRLPDGSVQGAYGYVDETGRQRIVKYVAGKEGFRVLKDGEDASNTVSSKPAHPPRSNSPPQAQRSPSPPAYNPPPQPPRSQPAPSYVPAPQQSRVPSRSSIPQPQPVRSPPAQSYSPPPQPAYRAPPQPAYRPAPAPQRSYSPESNQRSRSRGSSGGRDYAPAPRRRIPDEEPDYDYPENDIQERRLVPIDTSLFNYNIGTNKD